MIRDAVLADIPAMIEMGMRFALAADLERIAPVDPDSLAMTLQSMIELDNGILLTGPGCVAGGYVVPAFWNAGHLTGQELFWWVDDDNKGVGIRLFDALEQAAKDRGAQSWGMITLESIKPDQTARFYERRGYFPLERSLMKVF